MDREENALITQGKNASTLSRKFNVDITEEEGQVFDEVREQLAANQRTGKPADYNISRVQMELVGKFFTPFGTIANTFLEVQKGRGNSEMTVKHYGYTIKKLKRFFCWLTDEKDEYYNLTKEEQETIGHALPFSVLESDNFESNFREYLLEEEGVSEVTVSTYFRDYRAIAYWLMDEKLIKKREIKFKNAEADIKTVYTADEIDKLLRKPDDDCTFNEYRTWVIIHWLLATGNRCSTIVNMKIKDIDFDDNMININTQKNKKVMRIPLELKLRKILKEYISEWLEEGEGEYVTEYLFPSSFGMIHDKPMTRDSLGHSIAEYNTKRGVKKTSTHLFRHTFVKNWIVNNGDLHSLQRILGHSTLEMVTKYANLWGEDLKPKVENYSLLATHKTKNRGSMIKRRRDRMK